MSTYAEQRAYVRQTEALAADYRRALGVPDPFAERIKGAVFALVAPRLALDAQMPDLNEALQGVDRGNFRSRRRHIGDSIRRAVRGRLGRDADIEDIDELLAALEREEEGEHDDTFREAEDFLDEELESMRRNGEIGEESYRRLKNASDRRRREAEDRRRHGRDRSPYDNFDARRRAARDNPPDFYGMPRPGGTIVPMESSIDRPGFGQPRDPGAKDRGFRHARQFGQDAAPTSFSSRFAFTRGVTPEGQSRIPGAPSSTY
jgi:hypothetical protein